MNYSEKSSMVRVSLFKESGKWYACGAIDMYEHYHGLIHDCVLGACESARANGSGWPIRSSPREWLADGGSIVCLEPYHEHSHPIMLKGRR